MQNHSSAPIVDLAGVHLELRSEAGLVRVLRGVDLSLLRGETVGLVGPSGSGKSSLLMIMAGLERATSGSVRVADADLSNLSEDSLARWRRDKIGIVFQDFHLVPTMTALENTALPLEFAGRADAFDAARAALARVGLEHRLTHYPGQLSGGEQQRVALARAAVVQPQLLLADEPTGNLDHDTGERVIDLMFELAESFGTTLLLITHDNDLAARCKRIVRMADGRIASESTNPVRVRA
ncbi:ABC transporter ATP-binding protein [Roseiterribacter gracilis]|uniref:ABC transporter n=1 Tax=Roseiterribacter gracilis TaxID=2812848 RepID=A0A8S8XHI8_9PROT|nr:ABC transporter [Rhodospirillales bacterium TMPK1]